MILVENLKIWERQSLIEIFHNADLKKKKKKGRTDKVLGILKS